MVSFFLIHSIFQILFFSDSPSNSHGKRMLRNNSATKWLHYFSMGRCQFPIVLWLLAFYNYKVKQKTKAEHPIVKLYSQVFQVLIKLFQNVNNIAKPWVNSNYRVFLHTIYIESGLKTANTFVKFTSALLPRIIKYLNLIKVETHLGN